MFYRDLHDPETRNQSINGFIPLLNSLRSSISSNRHNKSYSEFFKEDSRVGINDGTNAYFVMGAMLSSNFVLYQHLHFQLPISFSNGVH